MKKVFLFTCLLFVVVMTGCDKRDYVRIDSPHFVGFRFFMKAKLNGKSFRGNGDGALMKGAYFKFRVFDNIAGKYVLSFVCDSDGTTRAILPIDNIVLQKDDQVLSKILSSYLYEVFSDISHIKRGGIIESIESNETRIKKIGFSYSGKIFTLKVIKYSEDQRVQRFALEEGENSLVFDIIQYEAVDFPISMSGYRIIKTIAKKSFLEWLGEIYGGQT